MGNYGRPPDFETTGIHLFPDYKFYCSGVIIGWSIRTLSRGTITLSLWRRYQDYSKETTAGDATSYHRVRSVELYLEEGLNHIICPSHKQMEFNAGYIIGLQYKGNDSKAVISFDHWKCEVGARCYSEDIFISNENPNSFTSATTRLTPTEKENTQDYKFARFFVSNHTSMFPKIIPIILKPGKLFCLSVWASLYVPCPSLSSVFVSLHKRTICK